MIVGTEVSLQRWLDATRAPSVDGGIVRSTRGRDWRELAKDVAAPRRLLALWATWRPATVRSCTP